ncbi:MAG: tryptophan 7-halogenase [Gammaproteobacteria bacterium]|nr:tryptophan 7-halogenase [Gammaproteobacteria bacterium]
MPTVAVIGGGPAGATAAALLAKRRFTVCVFESSHFPRPHIGESLLPATIEALEFSGAAAKVREAAFTVKNGATMAWGVDHALWTWYFRETNTSQPHAYQVNRDEFDELLLRHAAACGAEICEGAEVRHVIFEDGIAQGIEVNNQFHAFDYVIDASGQSSLIAQQRNTKIWDQDFRNLAIYQYFEGGTHLDGDATGNILVESVEDGWLWKIPLKHNISSVGLVADRERALAAIRLTSVETWFTTVIKSSEHTSKLLLGANAISDCTATRDWSYASSQFTGSRHSLIGDAACFIDPLFSTGVHLAIYSATLCAALVATTFSDSNLEMLARESFERQYRRQYEHFRELARLFYGANRAVDSYFWEARRITGATAYSPRAAFVRAVSGQTALGYERTTLSHGVLPTAFTLALEHLEGDREARRTALGELTTCDFALGKNIEVVETALFAGTVYEHGQVIRRENLDDIPVSPFVADIIALVNIETMSHMRLNAALAAKGWSKEVIQTSLTPTLQLLFVEGVINTT